MSSEFLSRQSIKPIFVACLTLAMSINNSVIKKYLITADGYNNVLSTIKKYLIVQNAIGLESSGLSEEQITKLNKETLEMMKKYSQGGNK